jgi:hypothetical protein
MISTLTVSSSLIVSGGLTVNQLARKGNLVVYLDASPSTYTAYPFNSGSQSGLETSVLTWSNRWTDLSGKNNHAYPINGGFAVSPYASSGYNLTSSYLNTAVYISGSGDSRPAFRFNPLIETSSFSPGYSISMWIKLRTSGPVGNLGATQWILGKRDATGASQQYQFITDNSLRLNVNFWYNSSNSTIVTAPSPTLTTNRWYNITTVVEGLTANSLVNLYIDGTRIASASVPNGATLNTISKQIIIGRNSWTNFQNYGSDFDLSQFLIYNTALTPQEVRNNYQITKYKHQA